MASSASNLRGYLEIATPTGSTPSSVLVADIEALRGGLLGEAEVKSLRTYQRGRYSFEEAAQPYVVD
jgi:hypothetical protein